jgi:hypothetical protein
MDASRSGNVSREKAGRAGTGIGFEVVKELAGGVRDSGWKAERRHAVKVEETGWRGRASASISGYTITHACAGLGLMAPGQRLQVIEDAGVKARGRLWD